jgi:hypothetical protein
MRRDIDFFFGMLPSLPRYPPDFSRRSDGIPVVYAMAYGIETRRAGLDLPERHGIEQ